MTEADRMAKKMHCNFIGHLANEKDACVAVTGCPGDRMGFTVNSKHAGGSNRFTLHQITVDPLVQIKVEPPHPPKHEDVLCCNAFISTTTGTI